MQAKSGLRNGVHDCLDVAFMISYFGGRKGKGLMSSLRMEGYLPGRRQTTRGHRPGVSFNPDQSRDKAP